MPKTGRAAACDPLSEASDSGAYLGSIARKESGLSSPGAEAARRNDERVRRYALQAEARRLLPFERVAKCLRAIRPDRGNQVEVWHSPSVGSAQYQGLMVCSSVWHDPVCAATITERRRLELGQGVSWAREHSVRVVLNTYTFAHTRYDELAESLPGFLAAQKALRTGRAGERIRSRFAALGSVRALETTWSAENGWHPHVHELVFLPIEVDAAAYALAQRQEWEAAARSRGLDMNEHGYRCDDTNQAVADYVAKYGRPPKWDVDAELAKWHVKRSSGQHCGPFDLVRFSLLGDKVAGERFVEYAGVFKGQRQLHWSPGLRELLGVGAQLEDAELAARVDEDAYLLGRLTAGQWRIVLANDCRAELLAAAASGSWTIVIEFLASIGALAA